MHKVFLLFFRHSEVGAAMDDVLVVLDERAGIEEQVQSLAGCQLVLRMVLFDSFDTFGLD